MSLVGKSIGRYRIIEQLGQGGMAVVYRAYDTRLEREVALKAIRIGEIPESQRERLLKRFEREAKAQARFSHGHIVQVHDYGEYEGAPYLVMTYLPGGTLKQRVNGAVTYREAAAILSPIADALAYAHKREVLHRDVKPSNILFDGEGQPMLTDFGIAKLLGEVEEATLTGTGLGVGTPQYMAPEQWKGKPVEQTDIYALGVVFYELVTGRKPYDADTPAALILMQATEPLPQPSTHATDLPERVEQVLYKALAVNPEDRYENMAVFAEILKELSLDESHKPIKLSSNTSVLNSQKGIPDLSDAVGMNNDQTYDAFDGEPIKQKKPKKENKALIWIFGGLGIVGGIIGLLIFLFTRQADIIPVSGIVQEATETIQVINTDLSIATIEDLSTSTPRPSSTPIMSLPTPYPIYFRLFDDFAKGSVSNPIDSTIWSVNESSNSNLKWENGYIVFSGENEGIELEAINPEGWSLSNIGRIQALMRFDEGFEGEYAFTKVGISTVLDDGDGTWWVQCRLGAFDPENPSLVCDSYRWGDEPIVMYQTNAIPIEYGVFYEVAIEIEPHGKLVQYFLDGEEIGIYQPKEYGLLQDAEFTWSIGLWMDANTVASGAIDEVWIGNPN
ncbi:serine/threonine protein kinase [bacterium]|nr:serine/threonine protein kinase [bacterium]